MPRKRKLCIQNESRRKRKLRRCNLSSSMPVLLTQNTCISTIATESVNSTPPSLSPPHVNQEYPVMSLAEGEVEEHSCGIMNIECMHCSSLNFKDESSNGLFQICCAKGKVELPPIENYPSMLQDLLCGRHPMSEEFMSNIRSYNSAFSFASFGAKISPPPGHGPYCFRIHGQIYHTAKALHPSTGNIRKYAQLYILDSAQALQARMGHSSNVNCSPELMEQLGKLMEDNPFTKAYKMLYEVEQESRQAALAAGAQPPEIIMAIKHNRKEDPRRYNDPRVNEVAVVFQNTDGEPPYHRDLLIHLKESTQNPGATTKYLGAIDPMTDPMCYPILFPNGTEGWKDSIPLKKTGKENTREHDGEEDREIEDVPEDNMRARRRVSHMQFFRYRLSVRKEFNPLLNAGKLTQQYQVDSFTKMEANRLNFIKQNQPKLNAESYKILSDYISGQNVDSGKPVILPATYEGSARCQQQRFQDAIAVVRKYGKPHFFVTMTCNPQWKEIRENLSPWQSPENRADLISRVFEIKRKALMDDLIKNHVLGKPLAWIWVREFQKRGLPHVHILLIMTKEDEPNCIEIIDKHICSEIPDQEASPRLHSYVLKHMIHGPCGKGVGSSCMAKDECLKKFPKKFQEKTVANYNSYPLYRRRNTGKVYYKSGKRIDNQWVVPYNQNLLLKYNCHINTEVVATIKSVKYLYKYVYKGHDCANIELRNKTDETVRHVDARYVCAPEAMDRIRGHKMHGNSHVIVRLPVHLDAQHLVYYETGKEIQAHETASKANTMLTAWFQLNQNDESARGLLYSEIPEKYYFNKTITQAGRKGIWTIRKRGAAKVVSRMYTVSPTDKERFYLRVLLLNVRGATSYDDLKTIDGVAQDSFLGAARQLNLVQDDTLWEATLEESGATSMPRQMRELFAFILIFGFPTNPLELWMKFKPQLCEDFVTRHSCEEIVCSQCESKCLHEIKQSLGEGGKCLIDYNLPLPEHEISSLQENDFFYMEPGVRIQNLNPEQRHVFQIITSAIEKPGNRNMYFLEGPGGSGKTYVYKTLILSEKAKGRDVIVVASTGIAATLLPGGRTYHSMFKLPVPLNEDSLSSMKVDDPDFERIRKCSLIIWDEATMAHHHALRSIHNLLTRIMKTDKNKPCGGKIILMGGDWKQILTVVKRGSRAQIIQSCLKRSELWPKVTTLSLKTNVRATDTSYANWLLKIGQGTVQTFEDEDTVEIPKDMITDSAIDHVFPKQFNASEAIELGKRAILCPTNLAVSEMNAKINSRLEGETREYKSVDQIDSESPEECAEYPTEYLNTIEMSSLPPHKLQLKPGSIIMLLRNLNTRRQLCNGTRLIVVKLHEHFIHARRIDAEPSLGGVYLPRLALLPSQSEFPIPMKRIQFPLNLAFAMTINKAQGSTLEKVGGYLPKPVFTHGQLYVMCSRVRRQDDIRIQIEETSDQGHLLPDQNRSFTKNVVYREIFID